MLRQFSYPILLPYAQSCSPQIECLPYYRRHVGKLSAATQRLIKTQNVPPVLEMAAPHTRWHIHIDIYSSGPLSNISFVDLAGLKLYIKVTTPHLSCVHSGDFYF